MQPFPDLVGRVGPTLPLIAHYQRTPGNYAGNTGQADPLPNVAHGHRLFLCAFETPS
jgi:hypothetical protein